MRRLTLSLPILLGLLTACGGPPTEVSAPGETPVLAKGGGATGANSKAEWYWYATMTDNSAALLSGDGLASDGATLAEPSVYRDGQCGVRATIEWYGSAKPSGDAFFGPTSLASDVGCPNRRYQSAVINGGPATPVNWPGYVKGIMQVPLNGSITEDVMWGPTNNLPCARIRYVKNAGSGVVVTRTAGNAAGVAGEWNFESTGSHLAQCWVFIRANTLAWDGQTTYFLPFRVRVVEILQ